MFIADQPIKTYKDDLLNRHAFSSSLTKAILSYKESESLVIALYGKWGTGKTSIINMALENINEISEGLDLKESIVLRFNPWNYSDQNQLISQFFKQLSNALSKQDYASDAKKAGEDLLTYAKFFEPLSLIPELSIPANLFSKLFKGVGGAAKKWGEQKSKDLSDVREELNKILKNQPHKIIIVIDDIDRLNNTEIRQIFQLVKSLGDFPNTIYLLAFDKEVVINALKKVQEGSGEEYLDKMIQVPFEVPIIPIHKLEEALFSKLIELLKDVPQEKFDSTYWGNIYHSGLKYLFNNNRDITRFINTLRFSFDMVIEEVNPIDLIAITAIQVFIPELYYGIRDNKNIFSGVYSDYLSDNNKEQDKSLVDKLISLGKGISQDKLIDLLKRLFPKLEAIYTNTTYGYQSLDLWRKDARICSPENFDTYFMLSIPDDEVSKKKLELILSYASNQDIFSEALLELNNQNKITRFLERLEDYTAKDIPKEHIQNIVNTLMDIGDLFPEGESSYFQIDTPLRLARIIQQLAHRYDIHEEKFNLLYTSMKSATRSLYTIVHYVSLQDMKYGKFDTSKIPEPSDKQTINEEQLLELERLATIKIESWAKDGRLSKHRNLGSILYRWTEWGKKENIYEYLKVLIETDEGLIDFVSCFLRRTLSTEMSSYVSRTIWKISIENIEDFIKLEEIEERVRNIHSSITFGNLNEKSKIAIKTLLDTIDGNLEDDF